MSRPRSQSIAAGWAIAFAGLSQLGASFHVETVPGDAANTRAFVAQADQDAPPEIFVVSGFTLTILQFGGDREALTFTLDEGTSVIDIADPDGDGTPELYSIVGTEIRRRSLSPGRSASTSTILFSRETLLAQSDGGPRPYVLATRWRGRPALALPESEGLVILSLAGEVLHRFPLDRTGRGRLRPTYAFPPQAGGPGALEFWADSTFDAPGSLERGGPLDDLLMRARRASYAQAREASKLPPEDWPWFRLTPTTDPDRRVMYALPGSGRRDTLIRIRNRRTPNAPSATAPFVYSPERRYPGTIVVPPETPPDFNADGFADLLLWSSPMPGTSVDSLMRAARTQNWPVRLSAHVFSPTRNIYDGRPIAHIEVRLPLGWTLMPKRGLPLRHLVLRDINGDGRTDIALATAPARFAVWFCKPQGSFSKAPDYTAELPENIDTVALVADMGEGRPSVIALRGKKAIYVLSLPEGEI
ncbi:MAG: hypothetical protein IID09_00295 [Candidatus Hydrogenedentes bacterium]|nr:hypothetical protein [Candidatus Hydrogenedentota bacterium]